VNSGKGDYVMLIKMVVHLERIEDAPGFSWWAESDELPGFSVAADSLPELMRRTAAAIPDILADEGQDSTARQVTFTLAAPAEAGEAAPFASMGPSAPVEATEQTAPTRGEVVRQLAVLV
jgi:predicted RNase H-like HicB family nuclease